MPLSGREKATIFLSILGAETSARILRYLPDELADLIAAGINHLPTPSPQALHEVMKEFKGFLALPQGSSGLQHRLEEKPQYKPAAPKRSYAFLMYERPQISAFVISILPEEEKEDALNSLPREKGIVQELIYSLKRNPLSPKMEAAIREQFKEKLLF